MLISSEFSDFMLISENCQTYLYAQTMPNPKFLQNPVSLARTGFSMGFDSFADGCSRFK